MIKLTKYLLYIYIVLNKNILCIAIATSSNTHLYIKMMKQYPVQHLPHYSYSYKSMFIKFLSIDYK